MTSTLLLRNARIWSAGGDRADCAVVVDGTIAFVGAERDVSPPSGATILDAGGRLVLPGLIDAHAHLLGTGAAMRSVDLKGAKSASEAASRIGERARSASPGEWIRGAGWDQHDWAGGVFPHRRDLDRVAPGVPVALNHTSGHCLWVNSAALNAAGITANTTAPTGGTIDVDDAGEPTGVLRDTAARLITDIAPNPTRTERIAALGDAVRHAHALGITGAHAMDVGRGELQAFYGLRDSGSLTLRTRVYLSASRLDEWFDRNIATGDGDAVLRIGGVKFFSDGALGSLTAWMAEPYTDSDNSGFPLQPVEDLEQDVRRCLGGGVATAIHAIGDRANHEVLNIYERARGLQPALPRRVEHAQLLSDQDLPRFAALGVSASVQPIHATQDMAKVDRHWVGRAQGAYRFASLLRSGANVAFGSDTPVETMDPIAGIHAAVTRRNAAGRPEGGWYPAERISVDQAILAYTFGAAAAVGDDATLGRIAPGYHGDFVVLSNDMTREGDPMRIPAARADITVVGGEVVYERAEE